MANKRKYIFCFILGFIMMASVLCGSFFYLILRESSYVNDRPLIIKNFSDEYLSNLFNEEWICRNKLISKLVLKIFRKLKFFNSNININIGEYEIPSFASLYDVMYTISYGKKFLRKVTIPEGYSVHQVLEKLNKNEFLVGEIEDIPREGSLMPDTYVFTYPTYRQYIIEKSKQLMDEYLNSVWEKRSSKSVIKNKSEAIILASIVEKESCNDAPIIAGVFSNRLRRNMRLQSDPTAMYGITMGGKLGRLLTSNDLKNISPYNTYINDGLPPAPICNPSRESIFAVLNPSDTNFLFFLHDKNGVAYFAKNFKEHRKNIQKAYRNIK